MSDSTNPDNPSHHPPVSDWRRRRGLAAFIALIVFAVVIAGIAFVGESLGHSSTNSSSGPTITVTGSGTVTGVPNTLSFQIGVSTTASSAQSALTQNNAKVSALEASLTSNGVTKKNLQTSGLNIYDQTNNEGNITGFTVEDDLTVTTHDLKHAGTIIDGAAQVAGNGVQLSGVTFSISNQSSLLAAARARAVRNAHVEATQLAKGANSTVVGLVRVTDQENTGSTGIVYPYRDFAAATSTAVPIQAGSQQINVQVTVIYRLSN